MAKILVLGIGNVLCGDEGIGCRVAEYLYATRIFPPAVRIADGGTMGQELLGPVMEADRLLIIDCADFGLPPGTPEIRSSAPRWLGWAKLSPHQGGFAEVLALAELKNSLPATISLLGIQPEILQFGEKLSPLLAENLPTYANMAEKILADWGLPAIPRETPEFLSDTPVALQNYEATFKTGQGN